ncbi:unnamed protein product [Trichobilharzia regenti]|nr:unnamed protein product [Trichobilharzia regenti]
MTVTSYRLSFIHNTLKCSTHSHATSAGNNVGEIICIIGLKKNVSASNSSQNNKAGDSNSGGCKAVVKTDELSLNAAILIKQSEYAAGSKHTPPRFQKIIKSCRQFWAGNFPDWSCCLEKELRKSPQILENALSEPHFPHGFSMQLAKIFHFNIKLAGFLDACTASGEVFQFLRFCDSMYKDSRTVKGFQRGYLVESSLVYEKLANYYAKKVSFINLYSKLMAKPAIGPNFKSNEINRIAVTLSYFLFTLTLVLI